MTQSKAEAAAAARARFEAALTSAADQDSQARQLRRELEVARRGSRLAQTVIVFLSAVITWYGSANAHAALTHHTTGSLAAWLPYPAIEIGLISEIQIGGYLARYNFRSGWGTALRFVTGASAVLLNAWWPIQTHDVGGALLHVLGPITQVFLVEALAAYRRGYASTIVALSDRLQARLDELHAQTAADFPDPGPDQSRQNQTPTRRGESGKNTATSRDTPPIESGQTRSPQATPSDGAEPETRSREDLLAATRALADQLAAGEVPPELAFMSRPPRELSELAIRKVVGVGAARARELRDTINAERHTHATTQPPTGTLAEQPRDPDSEPDPVPDPRADSVPA